jgi:hypothetical protein
MILFLDRDGCVVSRDKAVSTLFGVPDWVGEDIREYGTKYCCRRVFSGTRKELGIIRCEGMGGARNFSVETYPCLDGWGKEFVFNVGNILDAKLPLVCMRRRVGGTIDYHILVRNYRYMLDIARGARCRGYCVLDEGGKVVVFGDDLFNVVDSWAVLMRNKAITLLSVLV